MRRWVLRVVAVTLLTTAVAVAGCGGSSDEPQAAGVAITTEGWNHVHALGVDPGDGALLAATHTGLYRIPPGGRSAELVGSSRQDTMGFTIVGPGEYLGSGHPELPSKLPPLLGLIRSTDGGRTWRPVSLLGEADFHVLRASGRNLVGFDGSGARLLASDDSGRTWSPRRADAEILDLVMAPGNPGTLVASTERGLVTSTDGGRSWRDLATDPGFLSWPERDRLLRLAPDGALFSSADGGRTWDDAGRVPAEPAAFTSFAVSLYIATHDGQLLESGDGGETWELLAELP